MDSQKSETPALDLAPPATRGLLERLFKLSLHGTTVKTELIAGLTTFITMAYIIFVNPISRLPSAAAIQVATKAAP